ncbi:hypothetical protein FN846DRAFT_39682 [Sphaerosporella brunnea]|uniref:Transmembrane protein n=1 Tax=Sphaerosporella brunnea TaxID=1250544 RepID=A0A5J5F9H7_9PEZI|nr:hypothetical protein FN846DRAFT_39682 [Sphaerosporella brunnea]
MMVPTGKEIRLLAFTFVIFLFSDFFFFFFFGRMSRDVTQETFALSPTFCSFWPFTRELFLFFGGLIFFESVFHSNKTLYHSARSPRESAGFCVLTAVYCIGVGSQIRSSLRQDKPCAAKHTQGCSLMNGSLDTVGLGLTTAYRGGRRQRGY